MPLLVQTAGTGKRNRFPTAEVDVPGGPGRGAWASRAADIGLGLAPVEAVAQVFPTRYGFRSEG
jgi:hypothetical protein